MKRQGKGNKSAFLLVRPKGNNFASTGPSLPKMLNEKRTQIDDFNSISVLFASYFRIFLKLSHSKCGEILGFCLCNNEIGSLIKMNLVQLLIHETSHKSVFCRGNGNCCIFSTDLYSFSLGKEQVIFFTVFLCTAYEVRPGLNQRDCESSAWS